MIANSATHTEGVDELFSDYNTPKKTSDKREDTPPEDQEGESEPHFDPDNTHPPPSPSTYSAPAEKSGNETALEVLSDQAMKKFQEVINSGGVPGVPKGTPVKKLFQQGIFYLAQILFETHVPQSHRTPSQ